MQRFQGTVLVGLGEGGGRTAERVWRSVGAQMPSLRDLVQCLAFSQAGDVHDLRRGAVVTTVPGLRSEPGALQSNFSAFEDSAEAIKHVLASVMSAAKDQRQILALREQDVIVGDNLSLYVFVDLVDPVGGGGLLSILAQIKEAGSLLMRGTEIETAVVALLPSSDADPLELVRAYAAVHELDRACDHELDHGTLANTIYLIGDRNESGFDLETRDAVEDVVAEVMQAVIERRVATDASFGILLTQHVDGQAARYCSFGLGKITYPAADMRRLLLNAIAVQLCGAIGLSAGRQWDAEALGAAANRFSSDARLDLLLGSMEANADGRPIWPGLATDARFDERAVVTETAEAVAASEHEFERTLLPTVIEALAARRRQLTQDLKKHWDDFVAEICDDTSRGIAYARGVTDTFLGHTSTFSRDGAITKARGFPFVEALAKRPFDSLAEIDRQLPERLRTDLDSKKQAYREVEDALASVREDDSRRAAIDARILALRAEIETISARYDEAVAKVVDFDLKLQDASYRRQLLSRHVTIAEPVEDRITAAEASEAAYRAAIESRDAAVEHRQWMAMLWFTIQPVGAAVLVALLAFLAIRMDVAVNTVWAVLWRTIPFAAVGYIGWRAMSLWRLHQAVKEAERRMHNSAGLKKQALWALHQWHEARLRDEFDRALWSQSFNLMEDARRHFNEHRARLHAFGDAIDERARCGEKYWTEANIQGHSAMRPLLGRDDVERLLLTKSARVGLEVTQSMHKHPPSAHLAAFDVSVGVLTVEARAAECVDEVFGPELQLTVAEALNAPREGMPAGQLRTRLETLELMSRPLVQLAVNPASDKSETFHFLAGSDPDGVLLRAATQTLSVDVTPFAPSHTQELTLLRLKVAFPAFHIGTISSGRTLLEAQTDKSRFYVLSTPLPDLVPTQFTIGGEDDQVRRMLCLGTALGVLTRSTDAILFGTETLGSSAGAAVQRLRKMSGLATRDALSKAVEAALQEPEATDRLLAHLQEPGLDAVDRAILTRVVNERSPLA